MKQVKSFASPIIFRKGKRLYIRPILKEDAPLLTIWINDPEMTQYLTIFLPKTPEEETAWIENLSTKKPGDIVFAIVLAKSNQLIGAVGLHNIDFRNGTATLAIAIGNKAYLGKGYGTEATTVVLEYAFNTLNLRKICAGVLDFNQRSKNALEKCAFHEEGRRKGQFYQNGRYVDEILMAVFKEEFIPILSK